MTSRIRKAFAITALALLAAFAAPTAASASTGEPASLSARSVDVKIFNDSDCMFVFSSGTIWHGVETILPPAKIQPHTTVMFRTESNGFMTGTEAEVTYAPAAGCAKQPPTFTVYWNNPYVGSNSYFWEFNTANPWHWKMTMSGGSGNNATILFHLFV